MGNVFPPKTAGKEKGQNKYRCLSKQLFKVNTLKAVGVNQDIDRVLSIPVPWRPKYCSAQGHEEVVCCLCFFPWLSFFSALVRSSCVRVQELVVSTKEVVGAGREPQIPD